MTGNTKNEGEGSRTAARNYKEKVEDFVEHEDVDAKAEEARDAVESDEAQELEKAEQQGKAKARTPDADGESDR
jgi:Ran GTPase-activating protein (RanGAP) involved in mRNA processing and transport